MVQLLKGQAERVMKRAIVCHDEGGWCDESTRALLTAAAVLFSVAAYAQYYPYGKGKAPPPPPVVTKG
jgi:hypothetical protein